MTTRNTAQAGERTLSTIPKPALKSGIIYSEDNGRLVCLHCAGMTAKFTGRGRSGMRVTAMTQDDAMEWEEVFNKPLSCENGCTTYRSIKQVA